MILQKAAPENELIFLMIIIEIGVCLRAHLQMSEMSNENEDAKKTSCIQLTDESVSTWFAFYMIWPM